MRARARDSSSINCCLDLVSSFITSVPRAAGRQMTEFWAVIAVCPDSYAASPNNGCARDRAWRLNLLRSVEVGQARACRWTRDAWWALFISSQVDAL